MATHCTIRCWPGGDPSACQAVYKGAYEDAGKQGWCIGHYDGHGYYVCPAHKNTVWNPRPLVDR